MAKVPGRVKVLADFHNHSCLSPCGSPEQSPAILARFARKKGINLLALTDHNSALNAPAFEECCRREGLVPLFGMEASSREEVHVLCLFATAQAALDFGAELLGYLPSLPYDSTSPDDQLVVDAEGLLIERAQHCFGACLDLGFDALCSLADSRGALVIPAHVDRSFMSVGSQLGSLPRGPYAAVEALRPPPVSLKAGYTVITGSDAHEPGAVGRRPFALSLPEGWRELEASVLLEEVGLALRRGQARPGWGIPGTTQ
ncbi:MAG: PHP domain-containing protein [Rectinemataceae bacterium]